MKKPIICTFVLLCFSTAVLAQEKVEATKDDGTVYTVEGEKEIKEEEKLVLEREAILKEEEKVLSEDEKLAIERELTERTISSSDSLLREREDIKISTDLINSGDIDYAPRPGSDGGSATASVANLAASLSAKVNEKFGSTSGTLSGSTTTSLSGSTTTSLSGSTTKLTSNVSLVESDTSTTTTKTTTSSLSSTVESEPVSNDPFLSEPIEAEPITVTASK